MITNPTRQRALRGHKPTRPGPRAANTAEHHAVLVTRLTPRDRWILRMLHEHRVLTSHQITTLAFPSFRSGRMRLRELYQWGVVDRFQPFITVGTTPMHYILAPAGAAVLAAEDGLDVKQLGYRHDRAFGIAHSLRLSHTVAVNDWFTALAHHHTQNQGVLTAWWSETRCARHFGDLINPDGYGRVTNQGRQVEFFLEFDFGTEVLTKLAGKLAGYARLAAATAITTPVLVWLATGRRETTARQLLLQAWSELDHPATVPVATAAADLLDHATEHPSPADAVWLPLTTTAPITGRSPLCQLPHAWPQLPPPITDTAPTVPTGPLSTSRLSPPVSPTPPTRARPGRR